MTLTKLLENFANAAIIVLVVILVGFLVRSYFVSGPHRDTVNVGEKIAPPDFDFSKSDHTLLVALSHDCHFCQESIGFYQKLVEYAATNQSVQLIAVFDEEKPGNQVFLDGMQPRFITVKNVPFSSIKVDATPTVIDVNKEGSVRAVWRGKLTPQKEKEFFAGLN